MISTLLPKPKHSGIVVIVFPREKSTQQSSKPSLSDSRALELDNISKEKSSKLHLGSSLNYAQHEIGPLQETQASFEDTIPLKGRYPTLQLRLPRYNLDDAPDSSLRDCLEDTREVVRLILAGPNKEVLPVPALHVSTENKTIEVAKYKEDPMLPPKFKLRKNRHRPPSPPPPVLKPPTTEKVTKELKDKWNIPSALSNWKNNKGFAISLDKRVKAASGGKSEQLAPLNVEKFGDLASALDTAERDAREEIKVRNERLLEAARREEEERELKMRLLSEKRLSKRPGDATDYPQKRRRN